MKRRDQPLFFPKGSVRAILAIAITLGTIALAFSDGEMFRMALPLCALVVGYYFGRRES